MEDWFLTRAERGNPASDLPTGAKATCCEPLVHGASYFADLVHSVEGAGQGRPAALHRLARRPGRAAAARTARPSPSSFPGAAERGVVVKGLVWRSHLDKLQYSEEENRHLGELVEAAGGEVLLDQRVRRGGSHHQKMVVLRRTADPAGDVAYAGGIDLCHSRRDDAHAPRRPTAGGDGRCLRAAPALARRPAQAPRPGRRRARPGVPRALAGPDAARHREPGGLPAATGSGTPT